MKQYQRQYRSVAVLQHLNEEYQRQYRSVAVLQHLYEAVPKAVPQCSSTAAPQWSSTKGSTAV